MFPFPTYDTGNNSFRSELESSLTRGGPSGLAYAEANKYALKQQLLETNEVRQRIFRVCCDVCARVEDTMKHCFACV